jgi:GntR family carbon starvation induced transcriptional regulator
MNVRAPRVGPVGSKAAASTIVYEQVRQDIVEGALMPGAKLAIEAVGARYAAGANPVREALNRLSAEGLVERRDQRGFFVAALTLERLGELVKTRRWLEGKALAESMAHRTTAWEEAVVLDYHRLARTPYRVQRDGVPAMNPAWEARHRAFHLALLSGCGSSWLIDFCAMMMDQSVRYRNVASNFSDARRGDALAEHKAIMEAALDGTAALAVERLDTHYRLTLEALERLLGGAAR